MHNPTDPELEELQQAAIDRGDDALAAFDAYIDALANRDEAIDENGEVDVYEATLSVARQELDFQLGRLTQ